MRSLALLNFIKATAKSLKSPKRKTQLLNKARKEKGRIFSKISTHMQKNNYNAELQNFAGTINNNRQMFTLNSKSLKKQSRDGSLWSRRTFSTNTVNADNSDNYRDRGEIVPVKQRKYTKYTQLLKNAKNRSILSTKHTPLHQFKTKVRILSLSLLRKTRLYSDGIQTVKNIQRIQRDSIIRYKLSLCGIATRRLKNLNKLIKKTKLSLTNESLDHIKIMKRNKRLIKFQLRYISIAKAILRKRNKFLRILIQIKKLKEIYRQFLSPKEKFIVDTRLHKRKLRHLKFIKRKLQKRKRLELLEIKKRKVERNTQILNTYCSTESSKTFLSLMPGVKRITLRSMLFFIRCREAYRKETKMTNVDRIMFIIYVGKMLLEISSRICWIKNKRIILSKFNRIRRKFPKYTLVKFKRKIRRLRKIYFSIDFKKIIYELVIIIIKDFEIIKPTLHLSREKRLLYIDRQLRNFLNTSYFKEKLSQDQITVKRGVSSRKKLQVQMNFFNKESNTKAITIKYGQNLFRSFSTTTSVSDNDLQSKVVHDEELFPTEANLYRFLKHNKRLNNFKIEAGRNTKEIRNKKIGRTKFYLKAKVALFKLKFKKYKKFKFKSLSNIVSFKMDKEYNNLAKHTTHKVIPVPEELPAITSPYMNGFKEYKEKIISLIKERKKEIKKTIKPIIVSANPIIALTGTNMVSNLIMKFIIFTNHLTNFNRIFKFSKARKTFRNIYRGKYAVNKEMLDFKKFSIHRRFLKVPEFIKKVIRGIYEPLTKHKLNAKTANKLTVKKQVIVNKRSIKTKVKVKRRIKRKLVKQTIVGTPKYTSDQKLNVLQVYLVAMKNFLTTMNSREMNLNNRIIIEFKKKLPFKSLKKLKKIRRKLIRVINHSKRMYKSIRKEYLKMFWIAQRIFRKTTKIPHFSYPHTEIPQEPTYYLNVLNKRVFFDAVIGKFFYFYYNIERDLGLTRFGLRKQFINGTVNAETDDAIINDKSLKIRIERLVKLDELKQNEFKKLGAKIKSKKLKEHALLRSSNKKRLKKSGLPVKGSVTALKKIAPFLRKHRNLSNLRIATKLRIILFQGKFLKSIRNVSKHYKHLVTLALRYPQKSMKGKNKRFTTNKFKSKSKFSKYKKNPNKSKPKKDVTPLTKEILFDLIHKESKALIDNAIKNNKPFVRVKPNVNKLDSTNNLQTMKKPINNTIKSNNSIKDYKAHKHVTDTYSAINRIKAKFENEMSVNMSDKGNILNLGGNMKNSLKRNVSVGNTKRTFFSNKNMEAAAKKKWLTIVTYIKMNLIATGILSYFYISPDFFVRLSPLVTYFMPTLEPIVLENITYISYFTFIGLMNYFTLRKCWDTLFEIRSEEKSTIGYYLTKAREFILDFSFLLVYGLFGQYTYYYYYLKVGRDFLNMLLFKIMILPTPEIKERIFYTYVYNSKLKTTAEDKLEIKKILSRDMVDRETIESAADVWVKQKIIDNTPIIKEPGINYLQLVIDCLYERPWIISIVCSCIMAVMYYNGIGFPPPGEQGQGGGNPPPPPGGGGQNDPLAPGGLFSRHTPRPPNNLPRPPGGGGQGGGNPPPPGGGGRGQGSTNLPRPSRGQGTTNLPSGNNISSNMEMGVEDFLLKTTMAIGGASVTSKAINKITTNPPKKVEIAKTSNIEQKEVPLKKQVQPEIVIEQKKIPIKETIRTENKKVDVNNNSNIEQKEIPVKGIFSQHLPSMEESSINEIKEIAREEAINNTMVKHEELHQQVLDIIKKLRSEKCSLLEIRELFKTDFKNQAKKINSMKFHTQEEYENAYGILYFQERLIAEINAIIIEKAKGLTGEALTIQNRNLIGMKNDVDRALEKEIRLEDIYSQAITEIADNKLLLLKKYDEHVLIDIKNCEGSAWYIKNRIITRDRIAAQVKIDLMQQAANTSVREDIQETIDARVNRGESLNQIYNEYRGELMKLQIKNDSEKLANCQEYFSYIQKRVLLRDKALQEILDARINKGESLDEICNDSLRKAEFLKLNNKEDFPFFRDFYTYIKTKQMIRDKEIAAQLNANEVANNSSNLDPELAKLNTLIEKKKNLIAIINGQESLYAKKQTDELRKLESSRESYLHEIIARYFDKTKKILTEKEKYEHKEGNHSFKYPEQEFSFLVLFSPITFFEILLTLSSNCFIFIFMLIRILITKVYTYFYNRFK